MPAVELVALIRGLDAWGEHEENTARLLDIRSYELGLAWSDRTIDPSDPEVVRARVQAKRAGLRPPPHPLVPPVALRPPVAAEERLREFIAEAEQYQPQPAGPRQVSSDEFDEALGL